MSDRLRERQLIEWQTREIAVYVAASAGQKKLLAQAQKIGSPESVVRPPGAGSGGPPGLGFDPENMDDRHLAQIADGNPNWLSMGRVVGGIQKPGSASG